MDKILENSSSMIKEKEKVFICYPNNGNLWDPVKKEYIEGT